MLDKRVGGWLQSPQLFGFSFYPSEVTLMRHSAAALCAALLFALSASATAAPLVTIEFLARPDGTTQPFSSTITATSVGEAFDYIVVATLAPAGTTNSNLVNGVETSNAIGSWQYSGGDGINGTVYSMYQATTNTTQISFKNRDGSVTRRTTRMQARMRT